MPEKKKFFLKEYVLNTSFHCHKYLAEHDRHWSERVFWGICCVLSWIATFTLVFSAWNDFQNNAISFVVETSYLEWDTNFPSVVVCEADNLKKIAEFTDRVFGDPHDYNLDEVVKELVFFKGLSFYTLQTCGSDVQDHENCLVKNFTDFANEIRSSCREIFKTCKWNDVEFDCCNYFQAVDTEMGPCYGINSIQTRNKNSPVLSMISNKAIGPGSLYLEIQGFTNVYTFGQQEVPSLTSLYKDVLQITPHIYYERRFSVKEIENQPEVKDVSIVQRKCRFNEESDLDVYRYYSYSACCVQCRKNAQLKKCGCIHHLMPNTPYNLKCSIEGLFCLNKYYNELAVLKAPWSNRTGLVCSCLPSCTEIEISIIRDDKHGITPDYAILKLSLERLPTERFKRNVIRGKLDLVVSMGGATALFLGASILSFVEFLYYIPVRPLMDIINKKNENTKFNKQ